MLPGRFPNISPLLTWVIGALLGSVSALPAANDPGVAPKSFILDDAILFPQAEKDKLSEALTKTAEQIGVSIYVAGYSFLEGEAARERATALCTRWLDGKPGLVIVYTRGSAQPAVSPSPELWRRYPTDEIVLAVQECSRLLSDIFLSPEQRVIRATYLAMEKFQKMETGRLASLLHLSSADNRLALSLGVALLLIAALLWIAIWVPRKRKIAGGGPYYFPDAVVNPRLGASFGGGTAGESGPGNQR